MFQPTEPWVALANDDGFGVGLFLKDCYAWNRGYFGTDYAGDEHSADASYMAATTPMVLDHNIVHEWDYELVVGTVTEIRTHVWASGQPATGPNYQFSTSRQGWHYHEATDGGWPITGKLHVALADQERDEIKSPDVFWKGNDNPKIYLRAAFQTQSDRFRMSWRVPGEVTIQTGPDRQIDFPIINDGQLHTYEIVLKDLEGWQNQAINQIQFQPIGDGPAIDGWIDIDWVATTPDGPTDVVPVFTPPDFDAVVDGSPAPCFPGCVPLSVRRMR